jgi:TPR repeat protein
MHLTCFQSGFSANLGIWYKRGTGVAADVRAAVDWYRRAAEQGQANAQYNLVLCYERGKGVDADARVAVGWYERAAAAAGDPPDAPQARAALARLRAAPP